MPGTFKRLEPKFSGRYGLPTWTHHGKCQAVRFGTYANDLKGHVYQCDFVAKYEMDNHRLCRRHAATLALLHLEGAPEEMKYVS